MGGRGVKTPTESETWESNGVLDYSTEIEWEGRKYYSIGSPEIYGKAPIRDVNMMRDRRGLIYRAVGILNYLA